VLNTIAFPDAVKGIACQVNKTLCRKNCAETPSSLALLKMSTATCLVCAVS